MNRNLALLLTLTALLGMTLLSGGVSRSVAEGRAAGTPDVYVAANNSFVITVPNLSKVAVGNPTAVIANVISPTEVLVQGNRDIEQAHDGAVNFGTSNVYVWSGDKRYVYRVIVIETSDDTALPYGVTRMIVEPNKVIVYGRTADLSRTERSVKDIFESLNVKYEINMTEVSLTEAMQEYVNVDRARLEEAVSRGEILVGMTLSDVQRSQGGMMPPIYQTVTNENRIIDLYLLPNHRIGVTSGVVASVQPLTKVPDSLRQNAIRNGIVMEDMTETDMIAALGQPSQPPTVRHEDDRIIREFVYPTMRVQVAEDRVISVTSNHPVMPSNVKLDPIDLGAFVSRNGSTLVGRAYRLQYISGAELGVEADRLSKSMNAPASFTVGYSVDGLFAVFGDSMMVEVIDNLVTVLDRPMVKAPIEIQQTKYTIPAGQTWNAQTGDWQRIPPKEVGFLIARFSSTIPAERRTQIADELSKSISTLPVIPFAAPLTLKLDGATLTISGVPEQVDILRNILNGMIPDLIGRDVNSAIAEGRLIPGMTRQQVEAARNVSLGTSGRTTTTKDGGLGWMFDLGDRVIVLSEDVLIEEIVYPGQDQIRNAVAKKQLVEYLLRSDVERILGEAARQVTRRPDGTEIVTYNFGEAVYWNNRLGNMNGLSGSEMQRLGISVQVPDATNLEFQLLNADEQQTVMRRGLVMRGMTERDVARVLGQAPFSIRPGDMPNEKTYVYADYAVVFRDGVAEKVTSTGSGSPRIIALKSRRASEIVTLILTTFPASSDVTINADEVSNRLIVRAPDDRYAEIERFAKAMDQQEVPQVLIEAKFVEMNRNLVKQLGVEWGLSGQSDAGNRPFAGFGGSTSRTDANNQDPANVLTGNVNGTPQTYPLGGATDAGAILGMFGGNGFSFGGLRYTNVDVMIAALEAHGDAEVLSSPRIVTLNNQEATLKSISTVYDVTTTQTINATTGLTTFATTTTPKDVGIELTCNPTIGQDGIISLDLNSRVSRVQNIRNFGVGANVIIINETSERTSQSRVMVRSGTPLVIGGLSSRDQVSSTQKVPFLGDLPLVGHLFRSERSVSTDVDLLIFLTARIVPPDGTLSGVDRILQQTRPMIPNPAPTTTLPAAASSR